MQKIKTDTPKKGLVQKSDFRKNLKDKNPPTNPVDPLYANLRQGRYITEGRYKDLREYILRCKRIYPEHVDMFKIRLKTLVLARDRVVKTLTRGKFARYRVVCAVGSPGMIGIGVGKSETVDVAKIAAIKDAKKNLIAIPGTEQEGYFPRRAGVAKRGATRVEIRPLDSGQSITASKNGKLYARLCKLSRVVITTGNKGRLYKGKVRSKLNYFTALHGALRVAIGNSQHE